MMNARRWAFAALLVGTMFGLTGCGESGPRLIRATGTVTHNGQPLVGAMVSFVFPDGNIASGNTDASGKFAIDSNAGDAKVGISKIVAPGPGGGAVDVTNMTPTEAMAKMNAGAKGKEDMESKPKNEVPDRYANPETSGLVAPVKVGGTNDFSFALVD